MGDPFAQPGQGLVRQELVIDGRAYTLNLLRQPEPVPRAVRMAIPAYLPNQTACQILDVCLRTIQHYTTVPYEVWVVDNNSPIEYARWLVEIAGGYPYVNVALNRTEPIPPARRSRWARFIGRLRGNYRQQTWGSYANAIGLEIATRLLDPITPHLMTLHMDTMPCHSDWLPFLLSALSEQTAASGVRLEKSRVPEGVLHVLGMLVDFQRFRSLKLDFFPDLPQYDVGDRVTVRLQQAGYEVFSCANTHTDPEIARRISPASPYADFSVDRTLDDRDNVIFMHLGRGVPKSAQQHTRGVMADEWVAFAETHLLD